MAAEGETAGLIVLFVVVRSGVVIDVVMTTLAKSIGKLGKLGKLQAGPPSIHLAAGVSGVCDRYVYIMRKMRKLPFEYLQTLQITPRKAVKPSY